MERPVISRPIGPRGPLAPSPNRRPPAPPLSIPRGPPPGKPSLGGLKLDIAGIQPIQYYSGPTDLQVDYTSPDDAGVTLQPSQDTTIPHRSNAEPLDSLEGLLKELDEIAVQKAPHPEDDAYIDPESSTNLGSWSDEVIDELQRLGEGAGGAVHKVKDKRSGRIVARKTITTRQAPRQLLREVSIMTNTRHLNIIRFYGAYISPSTTEVKIIMEYCEGGSLESVGKRLRDYGAVVGEKIAGRLAEGVSFLINSVYDPGI